MWFLYRQECPAVSCSILAPLQNYLGYQLFWSSWLLGRAWQPRGVGVIKGLRACLWAFLRVLFTLVAKGKKDNAAKPFSSNCLLCDRCRLLSFRWSNEKGSLFAVFSRALKPIAAVLPLMCSRSFTRRPRSSESEAERRIACSRELLTSQPFFTVLKVN